MVVMAKIKMTRSNDSEPITAEEPSVAERLLTSISLIGEFYIYMYVHIYIKEKEKDEKNKIKSLGLYLIIAFLGVRGCVCAGTL